LAELFFLFTFPLAQHAPLVPHLTARGLSVQHLPPSLPVPTVVHPPLFPPHCRGRKKNDRRCNAPLSFLFLHSAGLWSPPPAFRLSVFCFCSSERHVLVSLAAPPCFFFCLSFGHSSVQSSPSFLYFFCPAFFATAYCWVRCRTFPLVTRAALS